MNHKRPQQFTSHYVTEGGLLMVCAEDYFVLIRMSDGKCGRFRYDQWDIPNPTGGVRDGKVGERIEGEAGQGEAAGVEIRRKGK